MTETRADAIVFTAVNAAAVEVIVEVLPRSDNNDVALVKTVAGSTSAKRINALAAAVTVSGDTGILV